MVIITHIIQWIRIALPGQRPFNPRLDDGQGLVEYALILILVVLIVFLVLFLLGPAVGNLFSNTLNRI